MPDANNLGMGVNLVLYLQATIAITYVFVVGDS